MYSAYKLIKQGDNIQPWRTLFPIWNQSVVPCPVLTVASDLHTGFSRGRSGGLIFPSLPEFSAVYCDPHKGFGIVNKAEMFFWNSLAFSMSQQILKNFKHYFTSMWDECNSVVVWAFFGIGMKANLFQSCGHCWVFQICWHIECSTFTASSFRIWNSSTGTPSPPLALFVVVLPMGNLTSHSRMSGSRGVIIPSCLSGSPRSFLDSSCTSS